MKSLILPGVKSIRITKCSELPPDILEQSLCCAPIVISVPTEVIAHYGDPTMSCESSVVNGCRREKTTLEFNTTAKIPDTEHIAFIITMVNGQTVLIGTREGRFPVINYKLTSGNTNKNAAVYAYKVTHIAQKSAIDCII